jgi:hypothetical protein
MLLERLYEPRDRVRLSGTEPATFRLVAQRLNRRSYRVQPQVSASAINCISIPVTRCLYLQAQKSNFVWNVLEFRNADTVLQFIKCAVLWEAQDPLFSRRKSLVSVAFCDRQTDKQPLRSLCPLLRNCSCGTEQRRKAILRNVGGRTLPDHKASNLSSIIFSERWLASETDDEYLRLMECCVSYRKQNHWIWEIWGFPWGDYEECHLLWYKNPVRTSQQTHYVTATEPSQLILCEILGFHGGDYEECGLLWNPQILYSINWLDSVVET